MLLAHFGKLLREPCGLHPGRTRQSALGQQASPKWTSDIVNQACETLLAEVLERQGVAEGISFPDFRDIDSEVHTSPGTSDEAILASVVKVPPNQSDEDDTECESAGDSGPTVAEAAQCISFLRVFAEKRGLVENLARSISKFEAAVVAARPPRRQMKTTDFVQRC
ncbi:hypothetical protein HPB50_022433 [Hyalomma asiaticum]|uniref:Uncharacterized protein n=1 Tax=Hyalomma asiaticum TaxID=266040 RepID=A0ACB7TPB9_HYAAI|nr:hypothetical protein HPB50_022433 [Hyalomma asiaticum]